MLKIAFLLIACCFAQVTANAQDTADIESSEANNSQQALVPPPDQHEAPDEESNETGSEQDATEQDATEQEDTEPDDEYEVLFDGTSLENFRSYAAEEIAPSWSIEESALKYDGSGGGDIMTRGEYDNFELKFEWKVTEGANSGVMYRVSTGDSAPYMSGAEFQILDDSKHHDGQNELTSAGSLYGLYVPENKRLNPVGEWNTATIVLNGMHVEHWVNRVKVVDAEIESEDWNERLAASKFKDWEKFAKNPTGHICFQDHGDTVYYRNIIIRSLNETGEAEAERPEPDEGEDPSQDNDKSKPATEPDVETTDESDDGESVNGGAPKE